MTDDELADLDALPLKALRTRVAELEADITLKWQPAQDELHSVIETLRAENERLREALLRCRKNWEELADLSEIDVEIGLAEIDAALNRNA